MSADATFEGNSSIPPAVINLDLPLWEWSGVLRSGDVYTVAVNANSEPDAVAAGIQAAKPDYDPTEFTHVRITRLTFPGEGDQNVDASV